MSLFMTVWGCLQRRRGLLLVALRSNYSLGKFFPCPSATTVLLLLLTHRITWPRKKLFERAQWKGHLLQFSCAAFQWLGWVSIPNSRINLPHLFFWVRVPWILMQTILCPGRVTIRNQRVVYLVRIQPLSLWESKSFLSIPVWTHLMFFWPPSHPAGSQEFTAIRPWFLSSAVS